MVGEPGLARVLHHRPRDRVDRRVPHRARRGSLPAARVRGRAPGRRRRGAAGGPRAAGRGGRARAPAGPRGLAPTGRASRARPARPSRAVSAPRPRTRPAILERAFAGAAGRWRVGSIAGRSIRSRPSSACLDPGIAALAVAAGEPRGGRPSGLAMRGSAPMLAAVVGPATGPAASCCVARRRTGRACPLERVVRLPAAVHDGAAGGTRLGAPQRRCASSPEPPPTLGGRRAGVRARDGTCPTVGRPARVGRDARRAARPAHRGGRDRPRGGVRILAYPGRRRAHLVCAPMAPSCPARALPTSRAGRWRSPAGAPSARTRSRSPTGSATCGCRPGAISAGDGARLRLAALRAALARLDRHVA